MNFIKKINIAFIVIFIVGALSVFSYLSVLTDVSRNLSKQTDEHLRELSEELGDHINSRVDERFSILTTYSYYLEGIGDMEPQHKDDFAEKCAKGENMHSLSVVPYNEEVTPNGIRTINDEYDENNERVIAFYLPVDNKYTIKGTWSEEDFRKYVSVEVYGKSGDSILVKRDGTIISDKNGADTLEAIFGSEKKYAQRIVSSIQSRNSGNIVYNSKRNKRYICYSNIGYNNWYVVAIVSSTVVESNYKNVSKNGILLTGVLFAVFCVMTAYILYFNYRYGLYRKIVDERREIYAKQTGCVLFDYKVRSRYFAMSGDIEGILGYMPAASYNLEEEKIPFVEKAYMEELETRIYDMLKDDDKIVKLDMDVLDKNENKVPVHIEMTAIKRKNGRIVRIVGSGKKY